MANQYFNFFGNEATNEWNVTNDATDEFIEAFGVPVKYLPRTAVKQDDLFGEDVLSTYSEVVEVQMYLEDHNMFQGEDLFAQFGLEVSDTVKLKVQQDRIRNLLGEEPEVGDLIQFEFSKDLFEITFVEDEEIFYIHGKTTTYTLSAKKFEYSAEIMETGDIDIDKIDDDDTSTLDDSIQDFTKALEFTEDDPFADEW